MTLEDQTLLSLLDMRDDVGVLSFYVGITPQHAADPQPTWPIEIRNQVRDLRQRLKDDAPHAVWRAVHDRLDGLEGELERLLDPRQSGRGRALFATVADDRVERLSLQVPFRERVVFEPTAFVRPLVAAFDEGRPAGIVTVHRGGVRVLEWSLGEVCDLEADVFEFADAQLAGQKRGPSASNPTRGSEGLVHKERFEERLDENRRRSVRAAAQRLHQQIGARGWDRVVVAGEPHLRQFLAEELVDGHPDLGLIEADHVFTDESPHEVADAVWPLLRARQREHEVQLVEAVTSRALANGSGTLGVADTLAALNQARVDHIVFDVDVELTGYRATSEDLLFAHPGDAALGGYEVVEEPLLVERMVERAFATRARVTPVEEEAAARLAAHDGVASLLRW